MDRKVKQSGLPPAAEHYPFNLILRLFPIESLQPDERQREGWRRAARRTDVIADDLARAIQSNGAKARVQFDQALDHGLSSVNNPLPELAAFFLAMETTPYWVDHRKIKMAQQMISRAPISSLIPLMIGFGLPASYIASKVNQTLVRSGDLELRAAKRAAETTAWLIHCGTPGGLARGAQGFKSTARVRLVHAFVRGRLGQLPDWDYEAWDVPINQAQQSLTMLPFLLATLLAIPLGTPARPREVDAVLHFYRYLSHLMGIEPELQITSFKDLAKQLWLTSWSEIQPDEFTPRLNKALQNAIPEVYGLSETGLLSAPSRWFLQQYHSNLGRLFLGKHYSDALGFGPLNAMALVIVAFSGAKFAINLPDLVWPNSQRQQKRLERFMSSLSQRVNADLKFNRDKANLVETKANSPSVLRNNAALLTCGLTGRETRFQLANAAAQKLTIDRRPFQAHTCRPIEKAESPVLLVTSNVFVLNCSVH